MKKIINISIIICLVLSVQAVNTFGLDIVKDGKPVARIVVPDNADSFTKQAAEWIRKYVETGSGAELPILSEGKDQGPGPRICVGATKAAGDAGIRGDSIPWDGCRLAVKGDTLFLLGHDEQGVTNKPYGAPKGTCRAAVTFLEDFCGVRWLAPTPSGEFIPQRKDISVPSDLDRTVVPSFAYAVAAMYYHSKNGPDSYANNIRTALRLYTEGGHTWNVWVPVDKYYKDHPEYFALINGKRCGTKSNHLCTSNPDVKRLLLEGLRQKFDEGYDWAQLGQSDGFQRCECPACEAMDNFRGGSDFTSNRCERVLMLHRDLAEECLKSHPDKKVHMLVYGPTTYPSRKFDKFPDNVVLEMCTQTPSLVAAWQGKAKAFTAYVYWWGTYFAAGLGPKYTASQVAESLRYLRDNQFQGIYFCGSGECWGLEGHAYYACGKLMGNPDLDPKTLVKEYCDGLFGKAAPAMLQFFETLDSRVQLYKNSRSLLNNPEAVHTALYPPATLNRLESLLHRAEELADDERSRMWVGLTRMTFDYVKLTANAFTLYRAFQVDQNRANLSQLQEVVAEWRAHRDKIINLPQPEVGRWFPGHNQWTKFFKAGGISDATIRAPFDWDFEKMMAKYAAGTPQGPARLVVARVPQAPVIDGVIGEDEWKAAAPTDLNLMMGGPATVPTKVRMAFDDKNIYIAFACSEPNINNLRLEDYKRDGAIWMLDCAEMFFDPEAGGAKFLHFIMAPAKDCFSDARKGYIEDTLHPLFTKEDPSWNPDWKYAFKIDADRKEWTIEAEIPFASIGLTPPGPGARWKANFGRERYAGLKGEKSGQPELFLWSPNEFGTGFGDPLCFGDLYFEKAPVDGKQISAQKSAKE